MLGADVVIASRTAPGSRVEGAPPAMRDLMSKVFNLAVQAIAAAGHLRHAMRLQRLHRARGEEDLQRRRERSIWV